MILVECDEDSIYINGLEITFPIHLNTLKDIFGEPTKEEYDVVWHVTWDNYGVYAEYVVWNNIFDIKFLLSNTHKLKHFPNNFFNGQFLLDSLEIQLGDFEEIQLNKSIIQQLTYKGETEPYSIAIGKNFDHKEIISKDKYLIKNLKEEIIEFNDFGFKLSIIQELMYQKELLKPKFDLYEFVEWYDKRKIDVDEEGYGPIAEVTQYFKDLPIPKRLATEITEICQDGGNDIYLNIWNFCPGDVDEFDIKNSEDVKHFPNLKKAILCYAKDNIFEELNGLGIKTEWI
ncbi:MAG: hypothetical protein COA95_09850 [Methylophaga sp.]|nr:MAG: hypothetical protein COA95_09850 [Methylophaga sp.]